MAHPPAPALVLRDGDRDALQSWARSTAGRAGLAQRARIVLLASQGLTNSEIAHRVGVTRQTVISRRARYEADGLDDAPRSGRPRRIDHARIVAETLKAPPKTLGVTHWSSRLLATRLGIDNTTVARAWRDYGVCSRGGRARSSTPPTPSWWRRSPTWSVCIWSRQRTRSCCVWTSRVELGRVTVIAHGTFPQSALRTGRACLHASGSPRAPVIGLCG
jgi:transposase